MTTPNIAARKGGIDDSISDWLTDNWRPVAIGAAVVVALGGGWWLWGRQQALRETKAERALATAQGLSPGSPNDQTRAELRKVAERYAGTNAGAIGAMVLAQSLYENGKPAEGVAALEKVLGSAPSHLRGSLEALIAAGLSQQGKEAEAAAKYEAVARRSAGAEQDGLLADAARSFQAAGKKADALRIWRELADRPNATKNVEAKIRIGELVAAPQG